MDELIYMKRRRKMGWKVRRGRAVRERKGQGGKQMNSVLCGGESGRE